MDLQRIPEERNRIFYHFRRKQRYRRLDEIMSKWEQPKHKNSKCPFVRKTEIVNHIKIKYVFIYFYGLSTFVI